MAAGEGGEGTWQRDLETETRRTTNSVIVERNTPFLAGPQKLKMWMKTNKTSEVAESTFNPGAKQLPSSMSLRLCGLCSPSQTDVRRGR